MNLFIINTPYFIVGIIIAIGIYGILFKKNIIKIIIGISLIESAANLFLVSSGYVRGNIAPIFTDATSTNMVLPTPQALTLTSIVIGLAVTAMLLSIAVLIYRKNNSLYTNKMTRLKD